MDLVIKNVGIEDYAHHQSLYSKIIRGNFRFNIETHILDKGKNLQIYFFRDEDDIQSLIEDWKESGDLRENRTTISGDFGILRLYINEENIMINNTGFVDINVIEYNYNPTKAPKISKGKVAILIEINFSSETDNVKLKSDLKRLAEEEN